MNYKDIFLSPRWYSLEDLPDEKWVPINGFEGLYEISNYGRVKTLSRFINTVGGGHVSATKIIRYVLTGKGLKQYYAAHLHKDGVRVAPKVHRLVAEHFIPNPQRLPCVNHKNEDKSDNRSENLEWCTYSYNNTYNNLKERTKPKRINKATMSYPVLKYDKNGVFIAEYPSYSEAARVHNVPVYTIRRRCDRNLKRGVNKPSRDGYIWVRKDGVKLRCNRKNYE